MSITGLPGQGPVRVGIPVADLTAGLFCALGILTALLEREKSKKGQHITTSLLQAQIFMLDFQAARWLIAKEVPKQAGNDHPTSIPTGVFKTTDGHINIATTGGAIWERFCKALGAEAMLKNPDYSERQVALGEPQGAQRRDRHLHAAQEQRRVDRHLQQGRRAGRSDLHHRPGVRRSAGQASRHRAEREEEGQVDAQRGRPAVHACRAPRARSRRRRRTLGQHTDEVLKEFGFSAKEIAALRKAKADLDAL